MFRRVMKAFGSLEVGYTPHCLRHNAATMNLLRVGTIEQTHVLMRHVNLGSTLLYVDHLKRLNDDTESQIEKFILG